MEFIEDKENFDKKMSEVKRLTKLQQFEKALAICEDVRKNIGDKSSKEYVKLEVRKIDILINQGHTDKALAAIENSSNPNDESIYLKKIKIFEKSDVSRALEMCELPMWSESVKIYSKKINLLIGQKKYNRALQLCENEQFSANCIVYAQKILILNRRKKYEHALKLSEKPKYETSCSVQMQRITSLVCLNREQEALEICENKSWEGVFAIQSQRINILYKMQKFEEALNLANNPDIMDYEIIKSQKIAILIQLKKYDKALKICNKEKYKNSAAIQSQKRQVLKLVNEKRKVEYNLKKQKKVTMKKNNRKNACILDIMEQFKKISSDKEKLEEFIEKISGYSKMEQLIYLAAFCKANNQETIFFSKLREHQKIQETLDAGIVKKLQCELQNKRKKIFDQELFTKILYEFKESEKLKRRGNTKNVLDTQEEDR